MSKNKSDSRSNVSLPSAGTQNTESNDMNQPIVPKKLSFNSCVSADTPEKRLQALQAQMNGFLHKLKRDQPVNNRYMERNNSSNESSNVQRNGSKNSKLACANIPKSKENSSSKSNYKSPRPIQEDYVHPKNIQYIGPSAEHSRELIKKRISFLKKKLKEI